MPQPESELTQLQWWSQLREFSQLLTINELLIYKTEPCPNGACCEHNIKRYVKNNVYLDKEFDCPYFHHRKDCRREIFYVEEIEEFNYQGNFCRKEDSNKDPNQYSQNFFESLFHPVYYKSFECKRDKCKTRYCPYWHTESEQKVWERIFGDHFKRPRNVFRKAQNKQIFASANKKGSLQSKKSLTDSDKSPTSAHSTSGYEFDSQMFERLDGSHEIECLSSNVSSLQSVSQSITMIRGEEEAYKKKSVWGSKLFLDIWSSEEYAKLNAKINTELSEDAEKLCYFGFN